MNHVLTLLVDWPPVLIYIVAGLVVAAETATIIGLVAPGEITLLLVGFLSWEGRLHLAVTLPIMLVAGLVGDNLGYLEGRRLGHRLRTGRLGRRVSEERWEKSEALLRRHGGRAVFLARFIAFARTLTPRLAGIAEVPYRTFLPWNALGVVAVVGATVLVGYGAGRSYSTVADVFGQATGALFLLVVVVVALVLIGRYLGRYPDPVAALGNRLAELGPLKVIGRVYQFRFRWLSERIGVGGAVAVNVLTGVIALLGVGYALAWVIDHLVATSGLPLIDPLIMRWVEARRGTNAVEAARTTLSVLRGSFLVITVGLVAVIINWRSRVWKADLVGVLGSVGAFIPLVVISLVSDWEGRPDHAPAPTGVLPNQTAVAAASVGMLAWLLARRYGWRIGVPAWTAALVVVVIVGTARVYVGWSWPSEAVASTLLGALWVLVFMVAWHTRDRVRTREKAQERTPEPANAG
jgi:membrane protein DedA with SNARE-associated domain/membrane-associated phospholipid phosphatase